VLDVRGLTKVFGAGHTAVRAVDGLDLSVSRGEIVLVMGPSGSGKTTLLTMIGGLLRPTSGSVTIDGRNITGLKEAKLTHFRRHYLGFVFQNFNLLDSLNARENVEVALNFAGVTGKKARDKSPPFCESSGSATACARSRIRFPAASASASPSPGRSPTTRSSSSPTSRLRTSTPTTATRSSRCCATSLHSSAGRSS